MRNKIKILIVILTVVLLVSINFIIGETPMDKETHKKLLKQLKMEEGFRSKPYYDTQNKITIGYGRNLSGLPLTKREFSYLFPSQPSSKNKIEFLVHYWNLKPLQQHEAIFLLEEVIEHCEKDAIWVYGPFYTKELPTTAKVVILDLLYNLGRPRYKKFKHHIAAIKQKDYKKAATELRDSLAYKQDASRYERLASELENIQK